MWGCWRWKRNRISNCYLVFISYPFYYCDDAFSCWGSISTQPFNARQTLWLNCLMINSDRKQNTKSALHNTDSEKMYFCFISALCLRHWQPRVMKAFCDLLSTVPLPYKSDLFKYCSRFFRTTDQSLLDDFVALFWFFMCHFLTIRKPCRNHTQKRRK